MKKKYFIVSIPILITFLSIPQNAPIINATVEGHIIDAQTQELPIRASIPIKDQDIKQLTEVIIIGYRTQEHKT